MMEGDVPEETVAMRSDLRLVLGALPLFHGLDEQILKAIAIEVEWLSLPGGAPSSLGAKSRRTQGSAR